MTWLVSWPTHSGPHCETAPHQTAAEQKAEEIVRQGKAPTAVAWEIDQEGISE